MRPILVGLAALVLLSAMAFYSGWFMHGDR
jgi:hypothetical protein